MHPDRKDLGGLSPKWWIRIGHFSTRPLTRLCQREEGCGARNARTDGLPALWHKAVKRTWPNGRQAAWLGVTQATMAASEPRHAISGAELT